MIRQVRLAAARVLGALAAKGAAAAARSLALLPHQASIERLVTAARRDPNAQVAAAAAEAARALAAW